MKLSHWVTIILGIIGLGAILGAGAVWWLWQPVNASQTKTTQFIVTPTESSPAIAAQLVQAHLIKSPIVFKLEVKRQGVDQQLKAGSFNLSPSMSVTQIIRALANGDKLNGIWVTIPEGKRREEIADILTTSELQNFKAADFLAGTASKEGYLFPDTYLFAEQATAGAIITTMSSTFDQKVKTDLGSQIAASGHPLSEVITMASIVEREAKSYDDMRIVAGVLWKRIKIGMPLQSDVTVEYLHGYDAASKNWWGHSTAADRQSSSPFNSYLTLGLPPHPIANPGLNAIKATLDPVTTDALFYLSDDQGKIHTARTLEEHNQNIAKYLQ